MKLRSTFKVGIENEDGTKGFIEFKKPPRNRKLKKELLKKTDFDFLRDEVVPAIVQIEGILVDGAALTAEMIKATDDIEVAAVIEWAYVYGLKQLQSPETAEKKFSVIE
jgi:hypothetical protein